MSKVSGDNIIIAGLADEYLEFNRMRAEIEALKAVIASGEPVCPICKTKMEKINYTGYYDEFSYWSCQCEKFEDGEKVCGCYAWQSLVILYNWSITVTHF